jgi:hypothetical protein
VVNLPDATEPYEVQLPRRAKDVFTGEDGKAFAVPPGDGRVLIWE